MKPCNNYICDYIDMFVDIIYMFAAICLHTYMLQQFVAINLGNIVIHIYYIEFILVLCHHHHLPVFTIFY